MIRFQCPNCGAKLQVAEAHAGKPGRCPQCKGRTTVPQTPTTLPPVSKTKASRATGAPRNSLDVTLLDLSPAPARLTPPPGEEANSDASPEGRTSRPRLGIVLYPMNVSGVIHLLIFSVLPPLWRQVLILEFWMAPSMGTVVVLVVLTLYFLHYSAACLNDSAQGGTRAADINSDSSPLSVDALLSTGETILPAVALIWGPALAYYLIEARMDWVLLAWLATAGLTFPMIILSVNYFGSVRGANPMLVLPSIASVLGPYGALVACLSMLTALAAFLTHLSSRAHGGLIVRLLIIYVLLTEVHLLGRFYCRYQERLNWGT
jgi:hypothetical protein